MRLKKAKLFKKVSPFGPRVYNVLLLRQLLNQPSLFLLLGYDGSSSNKLNELRYLASNHGIKVQLFLRRWMDSIFSISSPKVASFKRSLLLLSSNESQHLLKFCGQSQFSGFLEYFPFISLGCQGLLSQEPFFELLSQPKGLNLLCLLKFLQGRLPVLWGLTLFPLKILLWLLSWLNISKLSTIKDKKVIINDPSSI